MAVALSLLVAAGGLGAASALRLDAAAERAAPASAGDRTSRADPLTVAAGTRAERPRSPAEPAERGFEAVVESLIRDRDRALNAGDASALLALSVPGSPAAQDDGRVVAALDQGYRTDGLRTAVRRLSVVGETATEVSVEVATVQSAHRRFAPEGSVTEVRERPEECAVLVVTVGEPPMLQNVAPCRSPGRADEEGPPPHER